MKKWYSAASAVIVVACVSGGAIVGCNTGEADGSGGNAGEGGTASGGSSPASGGAGIGGASGGTGGLGGAPSCDPPAGVAGGGGAGGEGGDSGNDLLADIEGEWSDGYGVYTFDSTAVTLESTDFDTGAPVTTTFHVASISDGYLIALNDESAKYSPCLYSRFEWTVDDGATYLCQSVFSAETAAAAAAAPPADADDLATGCSGFPWSELTPE